MFHFIFASFDLTCTVGSSVDDFIHSLRHQNIALEVDAFGTRNGPNESSYNKAITVTGDDKVRRALTPGTSKTGRNVQLEQCTSADAKGQSDTSRWEISDF